MVERRGRPPLDCSVLDARIKARPTPKGQTTLRTKCAKREAHHSKPCKVTSTGDCKSTKVGSVKPKIQTVKMTSCADANKVTDASKKTRSEVRKVISAQCKTANTMLKDKTCKVNQKTGKCRDSVLAAKKRSLMIRS